MNDLPTESEVILALEDYLDQQIRPVRPPEAYRALAKIFGLTHEQRNRLLPDSNEVHWENRMRQARRKLNNAGKLDRSCGRGLWALKSDNGP